MSENEMVVTVDEERAWAVDMSQDEFNLEYQRRNPISDVIPSIYGYLHPKGFEDRGMIPLVHEFEEDGPAGGVPVVKEITVDELTCPGCGYVAKKTVTKKGNVNRIGIISHMRHCKEVIANG